MKPKLAKKEWDFCYLSDYEHLKRCAVFYEYARQNDQLKTWIQTLRKHKAFESSQDYLAIPEAKRKEITRRLLRENSYVTSVELSFLVTLKGFPNLPFVDSLEEVDIELCQHVNGSSISKPSVKMTEVSDGVWERTRTVFESSHAFIEKEQSAHMFVIPWKGSSNKELASQFLAWVEKSRPRQFPEDKKRGRNSGSSDGASYKLNQLGAYRFAKAGFTRVEAHADGFPYYLKDQDWETAIQDAGSRVSALYRQVASQKM